MAGFNFERDLPHQTAAVDAVIRALDTIGYETANDQMQNPSMSFALNTKQLQSNLRSLQKDNKIDSSININNIDDLIFDISMETGTGKTYAYTKTLFELNKEYGFFKFVIAVPRVAIKAGTVGFLASDAAREHFDLEFGKDIKVYEVQSAKKTKGKKERMPQAIVDFCAADSRSSPNTIHVLVINSGMINSPTLEKKFDVALFDKYSVAHEAIAHTRAIMIIDEPHLFKTENTTFTNLRRFKPQLTLRYGATFDGQFNNLIYQLTAVEAFNQDLVKGIVAHVETFTEASNAALKLVSLDTEASFELSMSGRRKIYKLGKKDSLEIIHPEMKSLEISEFNKTKLVLSNGLEMRKGDTINPFSYAETLQNKMIQQAVVRHFEIEKELLSQSPRIKPLSLFFIDNIPSYREKDGAMRLYFEKTIQAHLKNLISKEIDPVYKQHLEVALKNVSALHGGYFSADNSDKDEAIEQETLEILHDKESLLALENPRRFIFSKWTLREGWDNPNIFQICKLRSSGSETSKLQEVGRGLRLPVNEYMSRDKSREYELHYYVDFTEQDFIKKLTEEINEKSGVNFNEVKLDTITINALLDAYPEFEGDENKLLETLGDAGLIKRNNDFKEGGFNKLKAQYFAAFSGELKKGKIKANGTARLKATIRQGQYAELAKLWESISKKVVLEYKFENERDFESLFLNYINEYKNKFIQSGSLSVKQRLVVEKNQVSYRTEHSIHSEILPIRMMGYKDFITTLSKELALSVGMLHNVFCKLLTDKSLDINNYLSLTTVRVIKQGFNEHLMQHAFGLFKVNYRKTSNSVHPTKFTEKNGQVRDSIDSVDVGVYHEDLTPSEKYLFNEIFYDSPLELENIKNPVLEVTVYAKIPKNSIRIPLVGGGVYSPDFAYVLKNQTGQTELNLVVETKDKTELSLGGDESKKIQHATQFFNQQDSNIKVVFKKQLKTEKIANLIKDAMSEVA